METRYVNNQHFVYWSFGFIIFDVLSLTAYTFPLVNWLLLPILIVAIGWLIYQNLRWALLLPLAELVWGSFGASFFWDIGNFRLTLRMVLFAISLGVWLIKTYLLQRENYFSWRSREIFVFLVFLTILAFGVMRGIAHGNALLNVFFDANGYAYILYLPVWMQVFKKEETRTIITLLVSGAVALSVKTLLLFTIFANQYSWLNVGYWYLWIRDTRIGEITPIASGIWRIFIQSQIYIVIVLVWYVVYAATRERLHFQRALFIAPTIMMAALLTSLSRSYWLGIIVSCGIIAFFSMRYLIAHWRGSLTAMVYYIASSITAIAIVIALALFPYGSGRGISDILLNRIYATGSDPAGTSRVQQLPILLAAIAEHPIMGSGFGTALSYQSSDPRIKTTSNPTGMVSTYAFEWGYLDQWLKLGGFMFIVYMLIVLYPFVLGWRLIRKNDTRRPLAIMLVAGLTALAVVHMFSPYLNHPLGLGYLMLTIVVVQHQNSEKNI